MKCFFFSLAWALLSAGIIPLPAQTPARPADPHQVIPSQPNPGSPSPAPVSPTNAPPPALSVPTLAIMADSSLREVLQELAQSWADSLDSGPQVPLTLTNAGTMRAKIMAATPCDVVIGADIQDIKDMTDKGMLFPAGQSSVARNSLVIYGRKALVKDDELEWFDLIGSEWKKVALGNPDLVASGRVAKRALQKHGLINDENKNVFTYEGTEALALQVAEQEKADAVIVYKTDLAGISLPGFETVALKSDDAPPIFYTAAVCHLAKDPALAHAFIDYCTGEAAREIWARHGFETN